MFWFLVVVMVLLVVLVASVVPGSVGSTSNARRMLDEQLATGELSPEEHATRVASLGEQPRAPSAWPALVLGLVLLVALGTFLVWGAGGGIGVGGIGVGGMMDDGRMMDDGGMMDGHMGRTRRLGAARAPVAGATEIEIGATDLRFDPAAISSTAGETMNITLVNDGAVSHDLTIDELGFALSAEPGERVTGSLTVDEPGTYEFVCTVRGHAAAGMRGILEVSSQR